MAMTDGAIHVDGVWKRYGLPLPEAYYAARRRLKARRAPMVAADSDRLPWALRGVSLDVQPGETFGIIGNNGAGKSTLLKILAGVTAPSRGSILVRGRCFPMIELNAGMHQDLSGRENAELLGVIMGLSHGTIRSSLPAIEAFCELGSWFEKPVRMYSSGMLARLGFAVAMHVDAEVLLVDEVLAVGDLSFQRKCFDRLETLRREGVTVLLVSHNIRQVQRICHRVALMDAGQIVEVGEPDRVTTVFYEVSNAAHLGRVRQDGVLRHLNGHTHSGEVEAVTVIPRNRALEPSTQFTAGEPMVLDLAIASARNLGEVIVGLTVSTSDFIQVFGLTHHLTVRAGSGPRAQLARVTIPALPLRPGVYIVSAAVKALNNRVLFRAEHIAEFMVAGVGSASGEEGIVRVVGEWSDPPECEIARLRRDEGVAQGDADEDARDLRGLMGPTTPHA